jgi:HK97 family phage major capsid protein
MEHIDRILRASQEHPWALAPGKLAEIAAIIAAKAESGKIPTESEISAIDARIRGESKKSVGGTVAVLPMFGTMSRRMGMLGAMSGGLSVETFSKAFQELVDDESISAIVIDVDSPGGSVYGIEELSQQIFDARSKKRIIAVADQLMASAAYYVASAADELVVSPSGEVGSIGVIAIHFDHSEQLEEEGIKVTIIKSGDRKGEGNPFEGLSDEAAEHMQSMVQAYYDQFIAAVARNRGVSAEVIEANYGQGLTFDAKRALERGMVDRIATLDQVLSELTGGTSVVSSSDGNAEVDNPPMGIAAVTPTADSAEAHQMLSGVADVLVNTIRTLGAAPKLEADLKTEEKDEIPDAAAGHAVQVEIIAPPEPAPEAREEPMSDTDKGAQPAGAAADKDPIQAERDRAATILQLARDHTIDQAVADAWVRDGTSAEEVKSKVLAVLKERQSADTKIIVGEERELNRPFANLGDQLMAIIASGLPGVAPDRRLMAINAAATGSGGAVPSDGGFLLQPEFTGDVLRRVYELGMVASRVRRRPIGPDSDGMKINAVDETSRVTGSRYGGIQMYWADEGDTVTPSKPKFRQMELYLRKLMGIWYVTDEMMKDSTVLQAIGEDAFAEETTFMVEDAIFRGTGSGQPKGFLNSNALVTVDAESGQAAATVNATNIVKMAARMWPRSRVNAAWFINVDVEPQLPLMTIGDQPVYLPPGGLRDTPFGNLLGMPVIPVEYCQTLGTVGDILLLDLDQYLLIDKGTVNQAWSIHVRFLNDEQTFKITYRVDGQSAWTSALTPYKGTNTLSPFVALATRS